MYTILSHTHILSIQYKCMYYTHTHVVLGLLTCSVINSCAIPLGGQVALSPKGIMRVVWERQRSGKDEVDYVPFLSVARSLGDFWSYNPRTEQFAVSPVPDVMAHPLDLSMQKFVVVASDGLWNVMTPAEVVEFVEEYRSEEQRETLHKPNDVVSALIHEALDRWERKRLPADNIAILIAFLSREADASPTNISSIMASSDATASVATSTSNASSSEDHTHHSPTPVLTETEVPTTVTPAVPPSLPVPKPRNSAYHSEVWPEGVSVEYQTKMKLRHRRKHKHGRRHRYGIVILWFPVDFAYLMQWLYWWG